MDHEHFKTFYAANTPPTWIDAKEEEVFNAIKYKPTIEPSILAPFISLRLYLAYHTILKKPFPSEDAQLIFSSRKLFRAVVFFVLNTINKDQLLRNLEFFDSIYYHFCQDTGAPKEVIDLIDTIGYIAASKNNGQFKRTTHSFLTPEGSTITTEHKTQTACTTYIKEIARLSSLLYNLPEILDLLESWRGRCNYKIVETLNHGNLRWFNEMVASKEETDQKIFPNFHRLQVNWTDRNKSITDLHLMAAGSVTYYKNCYYPIFMHLATNLEQGGVGRKIAIRTLQKMILGMPRKRLDDTNNETYVKDILIGLVTTFGKCTFKEAVLKLHKLLTPAVIHGIASVLNKEKEISQDVLEIAMKHGYVSSPRFTSVANLLSQIWHLGLTTEEYVNVLSQIKSDSDFVDINKISPPKCCKIDSPFKDFEITTNHEKLATCLYALETKNYSACYLFNADINKQLSETVLPLTPDLNVNQVYIIRKRECPALINLDDVVIHRLVDDNAFMTYFNINEDVKIIL